MDKDYDDVDIEKREAQKKLDLETTAADVEAPVTRDPKDPLNWPLGLKVSA